MIAEIPCTQTVNIKYVDVRLPVNYGDEDIPYDFPLRNDDLWEARIEVDTGKILNWPQGVEAEMYMKVRDEGVYTLIDEQGKTVATHAVYVPHGLIPGDYGDYVFFEINAEGVITNWPSEPDVSEFFANDDD